MYKDCWEKKLGRVWGVRLRSLVCVGKREEGEGRWAKDVALD